ncbi:MAG TPA: multiheme c-type cytochrome [Gemmataceae bacterium]|nr:multiheme c-type cytochrome [Gemmataceae bacterium]
MAVRHLLLAVAVGTGAATLSLTQAAPAERPAAAFDYKLPREIHFTGNLSCASAACHAGADAGRPGGEYAAWVHGDPHSRAYEALFKQASRRMVERLHADRPGKPVPAHQSERCLSCHAPQASHDSTSVRGVGCESCHGPAEKYLTVHYQHEFKALTRHEKAERYGLYPAKDLAFRVTLCASCHVGNAGRDVDHALLAAGHPRLAFEYTGYHHNPRYQRHWRETAYGPDFDARGWEIGQIACAKSAAELLAARAGSPDRPWPELAESSCFACHKDLSGWLKARAGSARKPGSLSWGTWYFSALDLGAGDDTLRGEVRKVAERMENTPGDRTEIAARAGRLAKRLSGRLRELQDAADADSLARPYDGKQLAARYDTVVRHALMARDWDGLTQHYLAAAAIYYAWALAPGVRDPRPRAPLGQLGESLRFPKGYNSPHGADPDRLLELFRKLRPESGEHP